VSCERGGPATTLNRPTHPCDPNGQRHELVRLVRQIQTLTLEVRECRRNDAANPELEDKERRLEQLQWRLAVVARRTATEELDAAA